MAGRAAALLLLALLLAVASLLTIDLGPAARARAERALADYLDRPVRIGRLSIRLLPGRFVVEDLVIAGLRPADAPFLEARRIEVAAPWWTVFERRLQIHAIHMTDWRMAVETFPGGRSSFPRLRLGRREGGGFTTTVSYVTASRGQFTYADHATPWRTVARNLDITVFRAGGRYRGVASFSNGTVSIMAFEPMRADLAATFHIDGSRIRLDRIDLRTDGSRSIVRGEVNLARWPEQVYHVRSRLDLPQVRRIFFAGERVELAGEAAFDGRFRLFRGGRVLEGRFESASAGFGAHRFQNVRGSVTWLPDRLDVSGVTATFLDGRTRLTYRMWKPPRGRWRARLDAAYEGIDAGRYLAFLEVPALRLAARAAGEARLEWEAGRFADVRGDGELVLDPPPGTALQGAEIPADVRREVERLPVEPGPFDPSPPRAPVPVGGRVLYALGPEAIRIERGWVATPAVHVAFAGRTAWGERSRFEFRAASRDWQAADRLLAATLTALGTPTGAVPVGGYGTFAGVLTGSLRRPRIAGEFEGGALAAWNVVWGRGRAAVVVEGGYAEVSGASLHADDGSAIHVDGRFALRFPRADGREIDARVRVARRAVADFRTAFGLYEYPVEGRLSGEFHLTGRYAGPHGFGRLIIEEGSAWGEPFERGTASLRFEGAGVRLDGLTIEKGGGTITGAAYVGWDGTYSFDADGRRIPVERIASLALPRAPLSGLLAFTASGSGTFESPRYEVRARVADLFAGDEGVGQVTLRLSVRGELLTLELEAASARLALSGSGRISLTPQADAELTFRFADASLDPYVRMLVPRLSPFATAVASGTVRVTGELAEIDQLVVEAEVEELDAELFDYRVRNDGPIRLALDRHVVRVDRLRLAGEGTSLDLAGRIDVHARRLDLRATGDANLGLLQGFFRDLRSAGAAELAAQISGPIDRPLLAGTASITGGRIRHFAVPHSLEAIEGRLSFDTRGVRLDDVTARVGGGRVQLGGLIGIEGYRIGELSLTARGENMRLRYPEGFQSLVDADLTLRGTLAAPLLAGTVHVRSAVWRRRFDAAGGLLALGGGAGPPPAA
ncbi:MAG TPA: translocation/assembly module TamB domain-containing protein, partial [Vicinamibacterales bacterium]|nr:translocation/assembly module TamB domain-containing protein [Vicinamibacterales bacterium]